MIQVRKLFRRFVNRYGGTYVYLFVMVMYIPILFLSTWLDGKILPLYSTFFILGALFSLLVPATYIRYYNIYRMLRFKFRKRKKGNEFPFLDISYWAPLSESTGSSNVLLSTSAMTKTETTALPLQLFSGEMRGKDSPILAQVAPAELMTVLFS